MYHPINIYNDIHYSQKQNNSKKNFFCLYVSILLFILIFFGVATFDLIFWKNECNLDDFIIFFQNITIEEHTVGNLTKITKKPHHLDCLIFLYGVSFYFYFIIMCLILFSLRCQYLSSEIKGDNICKCILSSLTEFARDIFMIIVRIIFILSVLARMTLFIVTIIQYSSCHQYCSNIDVFITLVPFSVEFLMNLILLIFIICITMC